MISSLSDSVCLHLYILCFGRLVHAWIICQTNIFSKACKKCPKKQIWMYRTFVLNSSRTSVRLGAWFWSAKLTCSYQNHCASSRSVYLSRRLDSHWDKFAITHHLKRWESSRLRLNFKNFKRAWFAISCCSKCIKHVSSVLILLIHLIYLRDTPMSRGRRKIENSIIQ